MELTRITDPTITVTVTWTLGDEPETCAVAVRPGRLKGDVVAKLGSGEKEDLCWAVKEFITAWDLVDNGEPVGVTDDVILNLPLLFYELILDATREALRAEGKHSPATSEPAE